MDEFGDLPGQVFIEMKLAGNFLGAGVEYTSGNEQLGEGATEAV